jgi:hypothetical protein
MNAREATLDDKDAVIRLWDRCALTRPWNNPAQDFDFAYLGPASSVVVLEEAESSSALRLSVTMDAVDRPTTSVSSLCASVAVRAECS